VCFYSPTATATGYGLLKSEYSLCSSPTPFNPAFSAVFWGHILKSRPRAVLAFCFPTGMARWGVCLNSHCQMNVSLLCKNWSQYFFHRAVVLDEKGPAGGCISSPALSSGTPRSFCLSISSWISQAACLPGPTKDGR